MLLKNYATKPFSVNFTHRNPDHHPRRIDLVSKAIFVLYYPYATKPLQLVYLAI